MGLGRHGPSSEMETDGQRERHAETQRDGHRARSRDAWRRSQTSDQRHRLSGDSQGGASDCEYQGGGPNHQKKAETTEHVLETVVWGPRESLPCRRQLLEQRSLHSAFLRLSQVRKSPGTGKTCVQPWKQHLAGDMAGGTARGLGKRKDRQDSSEMRQTDGRAGEKIKRCGTGDRGTKTWGNARTEMDGDRHTGESQAAVRRISFPR